MSEHGKSISLKEVDASNGCLGLKVYAGLRRLVLGSLGLALITGLAAQVRIPIPISPVPITGQVFVLLLIGFLFEKRLGLGSQIVYAGLGGLGLPWFSGMTGGLSVLVGPTGGYILGFIPAVYLISWLTENFRSETLIARFRIGLVGLIVVYFLGTFQLSLFLNTGLLESLELGVVPFVWVDLIKILFVSVAVKGFESEG